MVCGFCSGTSKCQVSSLTPISILDTYIPSKYTRKPRRSIQADLQIPQEVTMGAIQFTRNHTDHSTDKGFQFEFFCDRCGNGFMSEFKSSVTGMAASALHPAG